MIKISELFCCSFKAANYELEEIQRALRGGVFNNHNILDSQIAFFKVTNTWRNLIEEAASNEATSQIEQDLLHYLYVFTLSVSTTLPENEKIRRINHALSRFMQVLDVFGKQTQLQMDIHILRYCTHESLQTIIDVFLKEPSGSYRPIFVRWIAELTKCSWPVESRADILANFLRAIPERDHKDIFCLYLLKQGETAQKNLEDICSDESKQTLKSIKEETVNFGNLVLSSLKENVEVPCVPFPEASERRNYFLNHAIHTYFHEQNSELLALRLMPIDWSWLSNYAENLPRSNGTYCSLLEKISQWMLAIAQRANEINALGQPSHIAMFFWSMGEPTIPSLQGRSYSLWQCKEFVEIISVNSLHAYFGSFGRLRESILEELCTHQMDKFKAWLELIKTDMGSETSRHRLHDLGILLGSGTSRTSDAIREGYELLAQLKKSSIPTNSQ